MSHEGEKMRASLVLNIIESYYKGEAAFIKAVNILAQEENKKGNEDFALKLLNLINAKPSKKASYKPANSTFSLSSTATLSQVIPKDKDSAMNLIEIIEPSTSFENLVLSNKMRASMLQIVEEWKKAQILTKAGINPTRRVLFYGAPGCGKTVMGFALAKELGLKVAYVRLDTLFSSYLGQTSTNLRKIFDAVSDGTMALFLDEFDSIGKKRDDSQEVGELKRIVITLLQNLDLLPPDVLVIAATNHQHLLDPAVWRRFDIAVAVDQPNTDLRKKLITELLKNYADKLDFDLEFLVKFTEGMSISRIKDLINQTIKSYLLSNEQGKIIMEHFAQSIFVIEKFNNSKDALYKWAFELKNRGITLRELSLIIGVPKSTLDRHLKQIEEASNV